MVESQNKVLSHICCRSGPQPQKIDPLVDSFDFAPDHASSAKMMASDFSIPEVFRSIPTSPPVLQNFIPLLQFSKRSQDVSQLNTYAGTLNFLFTSGLIHISGDLRNVS